MITDVATVTALYRYPVKSMQGLAVDALEVTDTGVAGDRQLALLDAETGRVLSAKTVPDLLFARPGPDAIVLPDGSQVAFDDPEASALLSAWLGRDVVLAAASPATAVSYEMTFDPPDDTAEAFAIPSPSGSFLDLGHLHLVSQATLDAVAAAAPEIDWDVRRFRPNIVIDGEAVTAFAEDGWTGEVVTVGSARIRITQPTVRCAMPLRAQPGLERNAEIFSVLQDLHANHVGVYADVVEPGLAVPGDAVSVEVG